MPKGPKEMSPIVKSEPILAVLEVRNWRFAQALRFAKVFSGLAGFARADDAYTLGVGLFLLGLGWSCTLIAGSALLSESVEPAFKASSQGASDLVMNLSGAAGGALAGVIIGTLSYGWLCFFAAIPVLALGLRSLKLR